ncbi:hypothetical protein FHS42_003204 [Streptomyces zagrosensis]|uniref:Uncharacterized protein n=1 Tax=Streptomyces zagrosensis TaxID=1042984 RepID=A0A7W9QA15_9ACTN|nr:hypothetical protein [Streptomyces zagrosensis]
MVRTEYSVRTMSKACLGSAELALNLCQLFF